MGIAKFASTILSCSMTETPLTVKYIHFVVPVSSSSRCPVWCVLSFHTPRRLQHTLRIIFTVRPTSVESKALGNRTSAPSVQSSISPLSQEKQRNLLLLLLLLLQFLSPLSRSSDFFLPSVPPSVMAAV